MSNQTVCSNCNLPKAPDDYLFPLVVGGKSTYCRCINWETLFICIALSVSNAKRLQQDADLLLKLCGPELYSWFDKIDIDTKVPNDNEAQAFASKVNYPRLITSLSVLILSVQEIGKAGIAIDHARMKKDLSYEKDYKGKLLLHGDRIDAASNLLKKLGYWPDYLERRKHNFEIVRQKSLYVDYDYNFGVWMDPTALGEPEDEGFLYSGVILSGFMEMLDGKPWRSADGLTDMMLGTERFNTFAFAKVLSHTLEQALVSLQKVSDQMGKDAREQGVMKTIRFAQYLDVSSLPQDQRGRVFIERLGKLMKLLEPKIAAKTMKEAYGHFNEEL